MSDVFTRKKRSEVMSRIRSRGNKETEITLMGILRHHKISGWRRHAVIRSSSAAPLSGSLPARNSRGESEGSRRRAFANFVVRPDFVFRAARLAVFVDGCFWHACPRHSNLPVNNRAFWRKKLAVNRNRDRLVNRTLRRLGWRVVRIWEHELGMQRQERLVRRIQRELLTTKNA
jgi:DNA mismatch endonuclease (patch repair protein)